MSEKSGRPEEQKLKVAVIGSGNIGTDLTIKLMESPGSLELKTLAGIDPDSEGLKLARERYGLDTTAEGIGPVLEDDEIRLVFDATSAKAHVRHAKLLSEAGKVAVDLTPAARGPYVVPVVNLEEHLDETNVNLMTCGAQATTPMARAVSRVVPVEYAEMVSTVSSLSAGPGTRANIDEFTFTTGRGLEEIGGAKRGKAIIVLNPADPPIMMRNTVYAVAAGDFDEAEVVASVERMVGDIQTYVPGYRLKNEPVFDEIRTPEGVRRVVVLLIEVEGAGDFLPKYAGNLDIMTSAARGVGERLASHLLGADREVAV